jgi:hypothetical protein
MRVRPGAAAIRQDAVTRDIEAEIREIPGNTGVGNP